MKLAIWSDLHIGKRQYRTDENNYNAFEWCGYKALKENVKIIKDEKPDLIINAGDTFETPNPSVLAMTNYFEAMNELRDIPTMTNIIDPVYQFYLNNSYLISRDKFYFIVLINLSNSYLFCRL